MRLGFDLFDIDVLSIEMFINYQLHTKLWIYLCYGPIRRAHNILFLIQQLFIENPFCGSTHYRFP